MAAGPAGPDGVLEGLARLVERSLVVAEEDDDGHARFRLLETVREFAGERLARPAPSPPSARATRGTSST